MLRYSRVAARRFHRSTPSCVFAQIAGSKQKRARHESREDSRTSTSGTTGRVQELERALEEANSQLKDKTTQVVDE